MHEKIDIKQIALILVSAVVFLIMLLSISKQIYTKKDSAFYTSSFFLKDSLVETIKDTTTYSKISAFISLDTVHYKKIRAIEILPIIKIDTSDTQINIVLSIDYNNKSVFWKTYQLQRQLHSVDKWQTLKITENFNKFIFNDKYIIKAYIWNLSKSKFYLKEMIIKFYEEPQEKWFITY